VSPSGPEIKAAGREKEKKSKGEKKSGASSRYPIATLETPKNYPGATPEHCQSKKIARAATL